MGRNLVEMIVELQEEEALATIAARLGAGDDPLKILEDARSAMQIVGKRFEEGKYFIPELVYSGEILKSISELVKPKLSGVKKSKPIGTVVIGTVAGDIHDIGKNIVTFMLEINGFKVYDLGVDVPVSKFVKAVTELRPDILGLSAFLTACYASMTETIQALERAGLRKEVRIMMGGNYVNDYVCRQLGADGWGADAGAAVQLARSWVGGK